MHPIEPPAGVGGRRIYLRHPGRVVRNNTVASFAGHLLWNAVDPGVVLELLRCWNA